MIHCMAWMYCTNAGCSWTSFRTVQLVTCGSICRHRPLETLAALVRKYFLADKASGKLPRKHGHKHMICSTQPGVASKPHPKFRRVLRVHTSRRLNCNRMVCLRPQARSNLVSRGFAQTLPESRRKELLPLRTRCMRGHARPWRFL